MVQEKINDVKMLSDFKPDSVDLREDVQIGFFLRQSINFEQGRTV
jgi:hypothetical protein